MFGAWWERGEKGDLVVPPAPAIWECATRACATSDGAWENFVVLTLVLF